MRLEIELTPEQVVDLRCGRRIELTENQLDDLALEVERRDEKAVRDRYEGDPPP